MNSSRSQNIQLGLYVLALGLALLVRLVRLGDWPLTEVEASWATQAFDLVKGLRPEIGPQPLYVLFTSVIFYVFQANDFTARLIPALFGAVLVLVPYFFRDRLGEKAALLLSFLLVFEPGLLAMSRTAGSPILAVSTVALAWGFWRTGNLRAAGIFAGLALLAGPQLWPGLIGLAVAYGLIRGLIPENEPVAFERLSLLTALAYAVGSYLVLGSLFLLAPAGLGAGLTSLTSYFGGWLDFTDVPGWRLLLALLAYQAPALIVAGVALVRGIMQRDRLTMSLGLWLLVALVLALANPFRQVADLAWMLLPLWVLAALEISRHLAPIEDGVWETISMAAFTMTILAFSGINFITIALAPYDPDAIQPVFIWTVPLAAVRWAVLISSLALLAVSIFMVAYGWSISVAVQGSVWGGLAALAVYSLSAAMAAGGLRPNRTVELWSPGFYIQQAEALSVQLEDISDWQLAPAQPLEITVAGVDSAALRWVLRDLNVTFIDSFSLSETPSIIIASDQATSLDLEAAYRGQDLIWRTEPGWNQVAAHDWLRWNFLHQLPPGQEKIILWVRSDLFVDSQNIIP